MRWAAFLRGVMPTNAKQADLRRAFESAGFSDVRTVLGSGNLVFDARAKDGRAIERAAEQAMERELGRSFATIARSIDSLRALLDDDPFAGAKLAKDAKRVVTFLREPPRAKLALPIVLGGARVVAVRGCEAFTAYVRTPGNPVFMTLIEKTFGKDVTTRTWDTLQKVVA